MFNSRILLSKKRKYLFGLILCSFISVICVALNINDSDEFVTSRREILLRKIGDELLSQSGDSTSRVLPLNKLAEDEYQIRFENEFTFLPESLVNITSRLLAKDPLALDYVVNVLNCGNSSVAYAYAISKNKKDDIVACMGRRQPRACYMVNVKFKHTGIHAAKYGYVLGCLTFLAFVGFFFLRAAKRRKVLPDNEIPNGDLPKIFMLGSVMFDAHKRQLIINENAIDLTVTETRLLLIFALLPNEIIERSRLQKEIWEDDGVIVGRSLDMFISKLRKKLESDPNINIVVIRGKGYKLEINA